MIEIWRASGIRDVQAAPRQKGSACRQSRLSLTPGRGLSTKESASHNQPEAFLTFSSKLSISLYPEKQVSGLKDPSLDISESLRIRKILLHL